MLSTVGASYKNIPFAKRRQDADAILAKYPDRVPIICERASGDKDVPDIDKRKFLVPNDLTIGQFMYIIRKRMQLTSTKALFLFVKDSTLVPVSSLIKSVYDMYLDNDGFLYLKYSGENVFGTGDIGIDRVATRLRLSAPP